jgi:hypothetical protein
MSVSYKDYYILLSNDDMLVNIKLYSGAPYGSVSSYNLLSYCTGRGISDIKWHPVDISLSFVTGGCFYMNDFGSYKLVVLNKNYSDGVGLLLNGTVIALTTSA